MNENQICHFCQAVLDEDEAHIFDDTVMCQDCYNERTAFCVHCESVIWSRHSIGDIDITLCQRCYDDYYNTCSDCDAIIHCDNTYYRRHDSHTPLCRSCYDDCDDDDEVIHEYSYKPSPRFYGDSSRYYGIELEIDGAGDDTSNACELLDIANINDEHIYIKHDGSLNDGFEIVTHPMSLRYHVENMPWGEITERAISLGYTSHNALTCGLHIHVNRDSLGDNEYEEDEVIARILYFIEAHWSEVLRFSRRTQYQMDRWSARYGRKDNPKEVLDNAKKSQTGRYTCVNITNRNTIEFRFFRGTLRYRTLIAAIQFTDEICELAVRMSDNEIKQLSWSEFVSGIDTTSKPELVEYLKMKRLYVNEPVMTGEEI